jgi:hypothetical protein
MSGAISVQLGPAPINSFSRLYSGGNFTQKSRLKKHNNIPNVLNMGGELNIFGAQVYI